MTREQLRRVVAEWLAAGKTVFGPVRVKPGTVLYTRLASADALLLGGWVRPANSIKEAVFPRHEVLYSYRVEGNGIELADPAEEAREQIVIGAHPCDAAAWPILDRLFNWDYRDEQYNRRRAATTVITVACTEHDEHCFCTSVGLGPEAERGSDAMLVESGGEFQVRTLTEKGAALFAGCTSAGGTAGATTGSTIGSTTGATTSSTMGTTTVAPVFDARQIAGFAREHFDDPFWRQHALACLGCGACAYTCPVCHCFDIVDEGNARAGVRARNWDACQFPMFTLHSSGHNPRHAQGDRQRQRIYHKFYLYPEKFGEILCTGCGNCARNCPAGLGVLPLVTEIRDAEPVQA